jgi:hypothetical protein
MIRKTEFTKRKGVEDGKDIMKNQIMTRRRKRMWIVMMMMDVNAILI